MRNEALVTSYASIVAQTEYPDLSPTGYAAVSLPLALILFLFDAQRCSQETVKFWIPSSLPTGIALVPRDEEGNDLPANPTRLLLLRLRRLTLFILLFCYPASGFVDCRVQFQVPNLLIVMSNLAQRSMDPFHKSCWLCYCFLCQMGFILQSSGPMT